MQYRYSDLGFGKQLFKRMPEAFSKAPMVAPQYIPLTISGC